MNESAFSHMANKIAGIRAVLRLSFLLIAFSLSLGTAIHASTPQILLRVTGLDHGHGDRALTFDLQMLMQLPQTEYATSTVWTDGQQTFRGVLLRDLMQELGITGDKITAVALNDYHVELPLDEINLNNALIAYERNGAQMSVRDKGPLWIVYPYDTNPLFLSEIYFARSIWQLHEIQIPK
jgi:hypothetical protein